MTTLKDLKKIATKKRQSLESLDKYFEQGITTTSTATNLISMIVETTMDLPELVKQEMIDQLISLPNTFDKDKFYLQLELPEVTEDYLQDLTNLMVISNDSPYQIGTDAEKRRRFYQLVETNMASHLPEILGIQYDDVQIIPEEDEPNRIDIILVHYNFTVTF